ncbi:hypothetical protein CYMTET_30036 [Cymbomonas tetramitiformis]|uniref:Right handed beta helix domain-containing protein n=1 Tax=Cymbomonas tetramitiformis TaxID=36881 RepID=A0AAE0FJN1_9CHLO|nr:hypothetical protein CYMTET_30036 [Cymbomonas tetramitiformis]
MRVKLRRAVALERRLVVGGFPQLGGALSLLGERLAAYLYDVTFRDNAADTGGCLAATYASVLLEGGSVIRNQAEFGGGLFMRESLWVQLRGVAAANNSALRGGALSLNSVTDCSIVGSVFSGNIAQSNGGAIYMLLSTLNVTAGGSIDRNEASFGGGMSLDMSTLFIQSGALTANTAVETGGGLHLLHSHVRLQEVLVERCVAEVSGGGLHLSSDSQAWVEGCAVGSCVAGAGAGVHLTSRSVLAAHGTRFELSRAGQGGAVAAKGANVTLEGCALVANMATGSGGGLQVLTGAAAIMRGCHVMRNLAGSYGGGAAIDPAPVEVALEGSRLDGNAAGVAGGAVIQHLPGPAPSRLWLANLSFENNSAGTAAAAVGPHVFWEYAADAAPPVCATNCTAAPSSTALFTSSAKNFTVVQDGAPVGPGGVAAVSGESISPPLEYTAQDYYGRSAYVAGTTIVATVLDAEASLQGPTVAMYEAEAGRFDGLKLTGKPGGTFQVELLADAEGWESVTVGVVLETCPRGSQFLEAANLCSPCGLGTLKLSNSTAACHDCSQDAGVECPGGDRYTLNEGYWMAAESVQLCDLDAADLEECVFDRVHACGDKSGACASSDPRTNAADTIHVAEDKLCSQGHRSDVVLCAACSVGYTMQDDGGCRSCPDESWRTWLQAVLVLAVMAALATAIARIVRSSREGSARSNNQASTTQATQVAMDESAEAMEDTQEVRTSTSDVFGIWSGWIQVSAQSANIYDRDVLPGAYGELLEFLTVFNAPVLRWLSVQCIMFTIFPHWESGVGYYWTFAMYAFCPMVVGVPSLLAVYRVLSVELRGLQEPRCAGEFTPRQMGDAGSTPEAPQEEKPDYFHVALFLLLFFQSAVATAMFQVFDCDAIYSDDAAVSYFMAVDRTMQCFESASYYIVAGIAVFVILVYVLGLPIALGAVLRFLHDRKQVTDEDGASFYISIAYLRQDEVGVWRIRLPGGAGPDALYHGPIVQLTMASAEPDSDDLGEPRALTMLDLQSIQNLFGTSYLQYHDDYYYWGVVEALRRLLQSSFVVVVRLADRKMDVFYAVLVGMSAGILHAYALPYVDADDNFLQALVLYNQCIAILLFIATEYSTEDFVDGTGGALMVCWQVTLQMYILYLLMRKLQGSGAWKRLTSVSFVRRFQKRLQRWMEPVRGRGGDVDERAPTPGEIELPTACNKVVLNQMWISAP